LLHVPPLNGKRGKTKTGTDSFRSDACVARFSFATVEFDDISTAEELAFWQSILNHKFPIACLIDSGGKSIHGWIATHCENVTDWETKVEQELFGKRLTPLGVDSTCRNEARLSRLPGHCAPKRRLQRLLYLNPDISPPPSTIPAS
jgi:hypothetical protein